MGRVVTPFVCLALLLLGAGAGPAIAASDAGGRVTSVHVRLPQFAPAGQPLQVLVALHGMGGSGDDFARALYPAAEQNGWLIVAPTIRYGDWRDPSLIAREEPILMEWLAGYIERLPDLVGDRVHRKVFLLGHSRGAQVAHRFALLYPEKVSAVAALSAGTYTLPLTGADEGQAATFPFGVGDAPRVVGRSFSRSLAGSVQWWVGVGGEDNNPGDVPRQWDAYIGANRVQRAQAFQASMQGLGARTSLELFKGAGHGLTDEMRSAACAFLQKVSAEVSLAAASASFLPPMPVRFQPRVRPF